MNEIEVFMYLGFFLAVYSVVGNDALQTLGTFLSSNEHRPWWLLALFTSVILTITLVYGWQMNGGDVSFGRLIGDSDTNSISNPKYKSPEDIVGFGWLYLLPPLVLLIMTRIGVPISTSFMILTIFNPKNLGAMLIKSVSGYLVAFVVAIILYLLVAGVMEKKFSQKNPTDLEKRWWTVAQWIFTGFLWIQWLIQDFANIYVYLPRQVDLTTLIMSIIVFWVLIAYIFYSKGGAIQSIVKTKTNTQDIRSATIVDLTYAVILYFFKELNNIPMSTTWVFHGLLAGREIGIRYFAYKKVTMETLKNLGEDLAKLLFGLMVSIGLVFLLRGLV